jgi:hypothetical protein
MDVDVQFEIRIGSDLGGEAEEQARARKWQGASINMTRATPYAHRKVQYITVWKYCNRVLYLAHFQI